MYKYKALKSSVSHWDNLVEKERQDIKAADISVSRNMWAHSKLHKLQIFIMFFVHPVMLKNLKGSVIFYSEWDKINTEEVIKASISFT